MEERTEKTCHIVGAADLAAERFAPEPDDFVIACDAGLRTLEKIGCVPDVILGDFDSLGCTPSGDNVVLHPVRKDDTDSHLALEYGLERGYRRFILHGCSGGARFDHTIANLQTMAHAAEKGASAWIFAPDFTAVIIKNGRLDFASRPDGDISVFAYGGRASGVTETGLNYTVENAVLYPDRPLGVSNSFVGSPASVSVADGSLLVIWRGDVSLPLPEISQLRG